jgi:hypothetical protein
LRPVALSRVSGRLTGPEGPLAGWSVHLIPAYAAESSLERTFEAGTTATTAGGAFAFAGVAPGDYVIKAWRLPPSSVIGRDALPAEPTRWVRVPVSVTDAPLTSVDVSARAGSRVRGRIVLNGTTKPPAPLQLQTMISVAFEPPWPLAFGARLATRVNAEYEFETMGLPPGRLPPVLPNNFTASGWYFESAIRDGRDLMLQPLLLEPGVDLDGIVLSFSDRRTSLSGTALDASGKPHASAAIVVFPAEHRAWIDQGLPPLASFETIASQDGSFTLEVRPGEYLVAAIDESRVADWRRVATVNALAGQAARITMVRGDNARDVRVVSVRAPRP